MTGTLAILNVAYGDTKLTFDPSKPEEVERSGQTVRELLRKGFMLLIEVGHNDKGPIYQRATDFDPETAEYIIAGSPPAELTTTEPTHEEKPESPARSGFKRKAPARPRPAPRRVPAKDATGVAVARTAGG